ncbi:MAG: DHH family phosphoesterase [Planctomycetes bacterium]|nr:DHH family phosphoesterase [Planctomycetota bacterium]
MFDDVRQIIRDHDRFLISGHVNPDGDCIGTQCALYQLLHELGKEVHILNADAPEAIFDFLQEHTTFGVHEPGNALPPHDVHFLTDCSTLSRLGSVGTEAAKSRGVPRVVVDHHEGSDAGDGDYLLWDVTAPSAGCLVHALYEAMNLPLSRAAAEGIFVSIVSDTGWFRYSNTDRRALSITESLIAAGLEPHRIYDAMYRRNPQSSVFLLADGLSRATFEADGAIAELALDAAYCTSARKSQFNTDGLLDPLRSVDGVLVVALLKELVDGKVKISLRANRDFEVDAIARSFGGGGHKKAAGATLDGPLQKAQLSLRNAILEAIGA